MFRNIKGGQVPLGGGAMSYVSFGHGEKALAVFPGLSDGLATVKGKALPLSLPYRRYFSGYTVYMFSRRDDLPEGYSIRDMADDQAVALERLGLGKVCLLGVSQGGMIAQRLAIDCAGLVEKLVIAVSAPRANPLVQDRVFRWIEYARRGDHRGLMTDTAEKSYSPRYLKRYRPFYPLLGLLGKPASYDRFLVNAEAILGFDALDELGKIACPTLIIGGADDKIVGIDASYEMKARIPGSELYVYDGLGHAAYEEAGDFYDRVFSFLERP